MIPAHRYVLAYKSEYFRKIFTAKEEETRKGEKLQLSIEHANYDIFVQMLKYIYTDTCDILTIGAKFSTDGDRISDGNTDDGKNSLAEPETTFEVRHGKKQAAFEVYEKKRKKKGKETKQEAVSSQPDQRITRNPIVQLRQLASRFGVKNLAKR